MTEAGCASLLRATGLRKEYGKEAGLVRAVDGIDLDVAAGETVAVMGPSGCGKSTLLHLLGGLDRPTGGEIRLAGKRIDQMGEKTLARMRRDAIGFVFQAFHLMDELTAAENVELPALLGGLSPRAARERAAELLERTGLADRASFLPSALSGGQRQRVAIARALANNPVVVLADEPTGNLDTAATLDVLRLFGNPAPVRADADHRHARLPHRRHRRPDDLHARRRLRRRDQTDQQHTGHLGALARWTAGPWASSSSSSAWRRATYAGAPGEAAMLLIVITAATTVLTLGLVVCTE